MATQADHQELLQLYCRVCGKRTVASSKNPEAREAGTNGVALKQSPMFRSLLSHLHDLDVDHESAEIFPKRVCQRCVEKFRSVRITVQVDGQQQPRSENARVNVFELVNKLYSNSGDDDLRHLARKFPVADFWAHSSSALQQCGVCEDVPVPPPVGIDTIKTCHIYLRHVDAEDPWGDETSVPVKTFKLVDIKDISIPFKPPAPAQTPSVETSGETAGLKRSHSQSSGTTVDPTVDNNKVGGEGASEPKQQKLDSGSPAAKVLASPAKPGPVAKPSTATNSTPATPNATSVYQNLWPEFNNMLGKNRKYRSDKIADILNQYITEVPKVLSDLKSSGIEFKAANRQNHFVKNEEFKKHVAKCLTMLQKMPTSKKSLLLFRAVTDTASDGQLNILSYVGIEIDLTNPNLGFLLRRIRNKAAQQKLQQQQQQQQQQQSQPKVQKSPVKQAKPSEAKAVGGQPPKNKLNNIPQGITISKVAGQPGKAKPANSSLKPASQLTKSKKPLPSATAAAAKASTSKSPAPKVTITPISGNSVPPIKVSKSGGSSSVKKAPSSISSTSSHKLAPPKAKKKLPEVSVREELLDDVNINRILLQTKIRQLNAQIPVNRQMKADIVRDVLLRRTDTKELMASHGILFDPEGGNYHLKALDQQRGNGRKKVEKLTASLNVYEWRAAIAQMVYDLLHPEDSLTLRIVGIFIDPTHEKVPLHFRLNFALKRTLLLSPYSACIMNHLYQNVQVLGTGDAEVDSWEMGLVELLYCDRKDARQLFNCGRDKKVSPPTPKVPPLVISKGKGAATVAPSTAGRGKASNSKPQPTAKNASNAAASAASTPARNPVIVQLRPKKGSANHNSAPSAGPAPTVVRLMPKLTTKTSPKGSASKAKRKAESYYNNKAKTSQKIDIARSSRRATRNKTEQRIHDMAKLESMSDNEFEHDYPGPGPQVGPGPVLAMEEDPLFDPLGLPDEGQLLIQHQHMMGGPVPVQTEAFMPNLVEIKTEIFEDFDNTIEEGVSPGSPTPHHDELDVQDDLEHAEEQQNSHPNHIEEETIQAVPSNPHPHIISENSDAEHETEDEEVHDGDAPQSHLETNGISSNDQEAPSETDPVTSQPSQPSTTEETQLEDNSDHTMSGDHKSDYVSDQPDNSLQEDEGFTGLQITNVESGSGPGSAKQASPTSSYEEEAVAPNFEDVVSEPNLPEKQNGNQVDMMDTHFDENQMQELESLEAMLSYTSPQPPTSSVPIIATSVGNVASVEDFDFAQFGVPMSAEQDKESDALDVLNSLASMPVPDAFGYSKSSQHHTGYESSHHGDVMQADSVDSIIEEVASLPHFDPSELR